MKKLKIKITFPNNLETFAYQGDDWFAVAKKAGFEIPTGCLTGSCGACEIDVNGKTIRPCICNIEFKNQCNLNIQLTKDPYW